MPTEFQLTRLEEILRDEIPLSAAMEIDVVGVDDGFVIEAPLTPNRNLQQTFFGGSLSALGLLAGWSWLRLALRDVRLEPDLVVHRSTTEFVAPAPGRTRARPHAPDEETWSRFLRTLRRKRRARIAIEISLESPVQGSSPSLVIGSEVPEPVEAVRMTGWFVAIER